MTENWINEIVGSFPGFDSAYGYPYQNTGTNEEEGWAKSDGTRHDGDPPAADNIYMPVNDGYDDGNLGQEGNPIPNNQPDFYDGNQVDFNVAGMYLEMGSSDNSTSGNGTFSVSFDPSKVKLWRPDPASDPEYPAWIAVNTGWSDSVDQWQADYQGSGWDVAFSPAFLVEAIATTGASTTSVSATFAKGSLAANDKVNFALTSGKLDVMKESTSSSGNAAGVALPADQKNSVGAFVPVNNDDDNYDNYDPNPAHSKSDKDFTASVAGEDDMLEIELHQGQGVTALGDYKLSIPGGFKVWWNEDKSVPAGKTSGQVTPGTIIPAASDTTLWVEAINQTSGKFGLNWSINDANWIPTDSIKVTSFTWTGPLNVPGNSYYEYTVAGAPDGGKWTGATGTHSSFNLIAANDASIFWGDGGDDTYKAVYTANGNYVWGLGVNVVKVTSTAGTVTVPNSTAIASDTDADGTAAHANKFYIRPDTGTPIDFKSSVTVLGAGADHTHGLKFINIGFIQNETHEDYTAARYGSFENTVDPSMRKFATQTISRPLLDTWDLSEAPWYSTNDTQHRAKWTWDPTPPATLTQNLEAVDYPSGEFPLTIDDMLNGTPVFAAYVKWKFTMYLAMSTTDDKNGAGHVYTQLRSVDWNIDYSGKFNGQLGFRSGQADGGFTADHNAFQTKDNATTLGAPVPNGTPVPVTDGILANDRANSGTWPLTLF